MGDAIMLFLNDKTENVKSLLVNDDLSLKRLEPDIYNIYNITSTQKTLPWLVKVYPKEKYAKRESKMLEALKNLSGIPTLLACGSYKSLHYIIFSRLPGTDLFEYVKKHGVFPEKELKKIARKLLTLLQCIHKSRLVHGDIKPENIIYDRKSGEVGLIDFEGKYTEEYASPERLKGDISAKGDMWAFGATLYYLYCKKYVDNTQVWKSLIKSHNFRSFLGHLLEDDKARRYTSEKALKHAWLA